ncbi:Signal transduction histidine kinase [Chitinophaga ginsengisegetis]|uniref:histidine kinase n=1 Tax=Chitinophaga ginsengisegetis TaxID=393003 RepID=A0A1T5N4C9_9BACT|nr:sensor histidine kinase [Chitinophaga ginsengisegetis]SKC95345.1 Signal transduction histidine kinase [Chitinophaga ginsengisegetis]
MNLIFCLNLFLLNFMPAESVVSMDTSVHYFVRRFTDDDGLPQNSVKFIVPDKNGFLWLATENGLTRFDGNYFLNFNSDNVPGLKSSRMARVHPNDTAITVETDQGEILTVTESTVKHMGTELPGYKYQRYAALNNDYYPMRGWPDDYAAHFAKERPVVMPLDKESYFAVYRDTISLVKQGKLAYRIIQPQLDLLRLFVYSGRLFYLSRDGHITGWEKGQPVKVPLIGDVLSDPAFTKCKMELFWNLAAHQVFIYTDKNCYQLEIEPGVGIRSSLVLRDFDLHRNYISSIYYDQLNNRVFLGSSTKGFYIATRQQFIVRKSDTSEAEVFYAQAPFPGNAVVTSSGLVFNQKGKYSWLPSSFNRENTMEKYTLVRDSQGRYWGRGGKTLMAVSPDFSQMLRQIELPYLVSQICIDPDGNLWVGGKYPGLYYLKTADLKQPLHFLPAAVDDVTYLKEGKPGTGILWVGTGKGLYRVHLPSGRTDTIRGLEEGHIRSIYVPKRGEVWITTYNKGVFLYRNERLVALPQDRQRYMATTHCITEDDQGYFWLTTNKGLFRIRRQDALDFADGKQHDVYYYYFGKDQGFNTNEFNGGCEPCAFEYDNGDISLPSLDGLVQFTPSAIRMEMPDKGIYVDWVEHNLKVTEASAQFDLPNNFQTFRLHISSPYFGDPRNLQFYYSLEKDDRREEQIWLPVNSDKTITFSSLSSGDYRIRIRKLKGFGRDQYIEKVLVISVQKAFYERLWFGLAVLATLICLIILLYKIHIRSIRRKNRLLELKVTSRTRELEKTMTILQDSDEQLRKQSFMHKRLLAAITHDIKTPLRFLLRVNKDEPSSGVLNETEIKTVTYDSLYRMHHLVDNLIHYMRISFLTGEFAEDTVDICQLIEEKIEIFRPVSGSKEIAVINHIPPGITVVVNKLLLAVVLHNLLDNAIKYTAMGVVELTAERGEGVLTIHLSDTGYGMPPAIRDWINHAEKDGNGQYDSAGIGLILVKELLTLINGRMFAYPGVNGGTKVSLQLRVNG